MLRKERAPPGGSTTGAREAPQESQAHTQARSWEVSPLPPPPPPRPRWGQDPAWKVLPSGQAACCSLWERAEEAFPCTIKRALSDLDTDPQQLSEGPHFLSPWECSTSITLEWNGHTNASGMFGPQQLSRSVFSLAHEKAESQERGWPQPAPLLAITVLSLP